MWGIISAMRAVGPLLFLGCASFLFLCWLVLLPFLRFLFFRFAFSSHLRTGCYVMPLGGPWRTALPRGVGSRNFFQKKFLFLLRPSIHPCGPALIRVDVEAADEGGSYTLICYFTSGVGYRELPVGCFPHLIRYGIWPLIDILRYASRPTGVGGHTIHGSFVLRLIHLAFEDLG